jgi:hypothetical protein
MAENHPNNPKIPMQQLPEDINDLPRVQTTAEKREHKEVITLGGTAITSSGKLAKSDFFRFIGHNLDTYDHIAYTPEEAKKIHTHLQKLSTGANAMIPMYCGGPVCPFKDRCPLFQMDKHPLGKQCLLEVQLMKEWTMRFFEEYDIDPNNFTEVGMINEMAEIELLLMRLNMSLARPENSELVTDQVVGIANDGETPLIQKQLSPFMEQKEKLFNRRSRIVKLMVGDRQEKYKKEAALKVHQDQDPSSKQATIRAKLDALARELEDVRKKSIQDNPKVEKESELTPQQIIDAVDPIV